MRIFAPANLYNMISITKQISSAICTLTFAALLTSCLGDGNESETVLTNYSNATVKKMTLENNANVCKNLSGYAFTIDNNGQSDPDLIANWKDVLGDNEDNLMPTGMIFNPDSLPVGSIADSLKITLSYASPSSVKFYQYDQEKVLQKVTNYTDTQTVWFDDYAVTRLEIIARDGLTRKNYFVKVNVHQSISDTICWKTLTDEVFDASAINAQRVDTLGDQLLWFVTKADNSQAVRTAALNGDLKTWSDETAVSAPSAIDLSTIYGWNGKLFAVGADESLLSTTDGTTWSAASTSYKFVNVLGVQLGRYNTKKGGFEADSICAIVSDGSNNNFAISADGSEWTLKALNIDGTSILPDNFPVKGFTRPIAVAARPNAGNTTSRLYIVGGVAADGTVTSSTWACDGRTWAEFEQKQMPAMSGASIVRYTRNSDHPDTFWILQPGTLADGSVTATLYFSENSGVTWKPLEDEFSKYADTSVLQALACNSAFFAPSNWMIYFFGGIDAEGNQVSSIRNGVLPELNFAKKR